MQDKLPKKIAILGVGLIGASLGMGLLKRGSVTSISGFGRRRENMEIALQNRCITHIAQTLEEAVHEAEIVVVCTPVETIAHTIRTAIPFVLPGTVFTDVGSTKASIFDNFQGVCEQHGCAFIGGHPIAGKETSGASAADENLYVGKTVVLTNHEPVEAFERVATLWRAVGATVVSMSATEHDAVLSRTSHLPHILSCLLSVATEPELYPFSGSGYDSMTRLSGGNPEIWRDILMDNAENVLGAMEHFATHFEMLRNILEHRNGDALETFLTTARVNREMLKNR